MNELPISALKPDVAEKALKKNSKKINKKKTRKKKKNSSEFCKNGFFHCGEHHQHHWRMTAEFVLAYAHSLQNKVNIRKS